MASPLSEVIQKGITLQKLRGDLSAVEYLKENGIPEHTVLRVVSCAAFRRKL
jgi:hypothetical protein